VYIRIKLQLDLQVDKSSVVVKGSFFPQVWTQGIESVEQMCDVRINLIKSRTLIFKGES
jgi:ribosomal protein L31E